MGHARGPLYAIRKGRIERVFLTRLWNLSAMSEGDREFADYPALTSVSGTRWRFVGQSRESAYILLRVLYGSPQYHPRQDG